MKNLIKASLALVIFFTASAFTTPTNYGFIGTYGVSAGDPSQIRLILNADNSFNYQDFSNPNHKIISSGLWELKGETVILNDPNSKNAFHNKWKFSKDGTVARSRKGVTFYTLGKMQ